MAITLNVTGNGKFKGSATNLTSYSVNEESTPIEGSDSTGATGTINFGVNESAPDTLFLLDDIVDLSDGSNGKTQGTVNSVSSSDGVASITADSRLNLLVATVAAAPYTGTLGGAFTYYLSLVGITTGYVVDTSITGISVTFPGWVGSPWDYIKQLCVPHGVEISLVSNNIIMRPIRSRIAETLKNVSESYTVSNQQLAQNVEVYYYNNTYTVGGLVYPKGGWTPDVGIYQIDAGKVLTENIPVDVSLTSLVQPTIQSSVTKEYVGPSSVYSVSGNDGLPIVTAQWTADGGQLSIAIGADGRSIDLTITAPAIGTDTANYAPFSIGVASSTSDYYSTLRIVGTGVFYNKNLVRYPTGVPSTKSATVVGTTVDNPFISTLEQANNVGWKTAARWGGPQQTISVSATVINRRGDSGFINYPTFANFDALYAGKTFTQFDTINAGKTYAQVDADLLATVADTFANQAFGNVAGARVLFRQAWYRIRSATIDQANISYQAELDTIFSDFDTVWAGKTFAQFDSRWTGKTFADLAVAPLWT